MISLKFFNTPTRVSKILTITFFIVLPIFAFFLGMKYQKLISLPQPIITSAEPTPFSVKPTIQEGLEIDPNVFDFKKELGDFPIYPNSLFIEKVKNPPCDPGKSTGFSICSSISYTWQTRDDYDQVSSWYREDKSDSGWVFSGGAGTYGGPRDAGGKNTFKKGNNLRDLHIYADTVKTEITLEIPYAEYKGGYLK